MWQPPSKIQVVRDHPVCGNPTWNKFWFSKSEFLEFCLSNNTNTRIVNITWCFVSFEQVLCDDDHVSATRSQPPKWQSMSRSDTQWHRIAVFCMCFRETLCCQLGLGDWLASQSPNQVDSTHGANKNCQPTTKSIIVWQCSRARPTRICKLSGLSMVLCTSCQTPCPTRQ